MSSSKVLAFRTKTDPPARRPGVVSSVSCVSVGSDEELLSLRGKILHRAGYSIRSMGVDEAELESKMSAPRLWIFCNSLDTLSLVRLAGNVRRSCHDSRLLYLSGTETLGFESALFHRVVEPTMGVVALLAAVRELTLNME